MRKTKRVRLYSLNSILKVAKILNACGKDMAVKYDLHHWDNSEIKSLVIVGLCLLKNKIYLFIDENKSVATFQLRVKGNALFFEKLAVEPSAGEKGYGSCCMNLIETQAKKMSLSKVQMEVYDRSNHAISFYRHKGYSQIGTTRTLKYTNLIMEKEL